MRPIAPRREDRLTSSAHALQRICLVLGVLALAWGILSDPARAAEIKIAQPNLQYWTPVSAIGYGGSMAGGDYQRVAIVPTDKTLPDDASLPGGQLYSICDSGCDIRIVADLANVWASMGSQVSWTDDGITLNAGTGSGPGDGVYGKISRVADAQGNDYSGPTPLPVGAGLQQYSTPPSDLNGNQATGTGFTTTPGAGTANDYSGMLSILTGQAAPYASILVSVICLLLGFPVAFALGKWVTHAIGYEGSGPFVSGATAAVKAKERIGAADAVQAANEAGIRAAYQSHDAVPGSISAHEDWDADDPGFDGFGDGESNYDRALAAEDDRNAYGDYR